MLILESNVDYLTDFRPIHRLLEYLDITLKY